MSVQGEEFANSGVLNLILSSIEACGQELHRDLLTNVVVTGGTSLSDGLLPRIKGDLEAFNDSQQLLQVRTKVVSSQRGEVRARQRLFNGEQYID